MMLSISMYNLLFFLEDSLSHSGIELATNWASTPVIHYTRRWQNAPPQKSELKGNKHSQEIYTDWY